MAVVFDIEGDSLTPTKIHCLSYKPLDKEEVITIYDYQSMREFFSNHKVFIGHNIVCFDIPCVERILGIKVEGDLFDTLPLSQTLFPKRNFHGLESWGEDFGVPKPEITDWENLTLEEYGHRCAEDVKINTKLYNKIKNKLKLLYDEPSEAIRYIKYLSFKMDCLREQEKSKWTLDVDRCNKNVKKLEKLEEEKLKELTSVMPMVPVYAKRTRPKGPYKKDGSLSVAGAKWFNLLRDQGIDENYNGVVEQLIAEKEPNPGSPQQVKDWLYSLGWKPESFKYDGQRRIPQVRIDSDEGKTLCPSVVKLIEKEPKIDVLQGLTVIQHRLSIFRNFLKHAENGKLVAGAHGLTNTLRFKHVNPLVNLPGVDKPYGEEIRGSLIASEGNILCGSDKSSLEDTTKRHFMYPYDPEYVEEMSKPGFDPHLDLAKEDGKVTKEEIDGYLSKDESFKWVKAVRTTYKPVNYSCVYGIQAPSLSRDLNCSQKDAQSLIDLYWERNWSIIKVVDSLEIKNIEGEMWLLNPVSGFWYSLRSLKDRFSTLNQGTGVYCFDTWVKNVRKRRSQLTAQFHDEIVAEIPKGKEEAYTKILRDALDETNKEVNLNIKLDIDVQFGETYAKIH